ncbi:MAG TPA: hypothetical protein VN026_09070 [Bacteroidia bacterium]|jgi:hypothetical protein|nr:hypothetical protein [Bacteroidia bacterium]
MKKITTLALVLTIISFSSCKKKTPDPVAPITTTTPITDESINVQYRVSSESGNFKVEYVSLEDNKVVTTDVEVKKIAFAYSFYWTKKQNLSIKAYNVTPSGKEVLVEIYVNGVLFQSGSANAPGATAIAEGVYN